MIALSPILLGAELIIQQARSGIYPENFATPLTGNYGPRDATRSESASTRCATEIDLRSHVGDRCKSGLDLLSLSFVAGDAADHDEHEGGGLVRAGCHLPGIPAEQAILGSHES